MTRSPESLLNRNNSLQSACSYITLLVLMAGLLVLLNPAMASGGPVPVQQATIVIPVAGAALAAAFIVRITRTSPDERVQKISLYSIQYGAMTSFLYACGFRIYFTPLPGFFNAYRDWETDRKSTRLNSSHSAKSRMPSSA